VALSDLYIRLELLRRNISFPPAFYLSLLLPSTVLITPSAFYPSLL
jgi:hypothetical protein